MLSYDLNVEVSENQSNISLNINLNKSFNFFEKSIVNLSNQNISSITDKISDLFNSGSSANITTKGFLIERNFITRYDESSEFLVEIINEDFENSLNKVYVDNDENSLNKRVKPISEILAINNLKEINYNVSFFEIPNEELIKSDVLLTDYLLRQYYYNQNKNYSVKKMESIVKKIKSSKSIEEIEELDFYKSLTKIKAKTNSILFNKIKPAQNIDYPVKTELTDRNLLFKIENINDQVNINKIKIYKTNRLTKIKTIVSDKVYGVGALNLLIQDDSVYGVLFDKKTYKKFINDKTFIYEILLNFDIYKSGNSKIYLSKEASIRL